MRSCPLMPRVALAALGNAVTALTLLTSACGGSSSESNPGTGGGPIRTADSFVIPAGAYKNQLGNFPARNVNEPNSFGAPSDSCSAFARNTPFAQPGLGVPLGGVGAGSFMINQAGSFGPWNFGGRQQQSKEGCAGVMENRILPQAAFHIREQLWDEPANVKTLAVRAEPWDNLLPAWNTLNAGEGEYAALWPFGWISYTPFAADVSLRFWSPIVAGDDEYTSMPVAFFDVRIENPTDKTINLSVMLTMPNAPHHFYGGTVREGLSTRMQSDADTGVTGVTLSASSPNNTPDAQDTDWTIAAKPATGQHLSYVTSWNAEGDGRDIFDAFSVTGILPNGALDQSASAAAVAVSLTLKPGESTIIPFALAWDFPRTTTYQQSWGSEDQYWMRRYTSFLGARETERNDYVAGSYPFHQGFNIANRMLSERDQALKRVKGWWDRIAFDPDYPDWMVRTALNQAIHMVFNTAFWASSLITDTPSPETRIGAQVPGTRLFCSATGGNWANCNEWDTDASGYLTEMLLWPSLERDRLRAIVQETMQDVVHGIGDTGVTRPVVAPIEPTTGRLSFFDLANLSIFRMYAYYRRTGDAEFLRYAYPAMLKLLRLTQASVRPGIHLPFTPGIQTNTWDAILHGAGYQLYNSQLYLLSMEVMIHATQLARELGVAEATAEIQQSLKNELPLAKADFETLLWNDQFGYYKMDHLGGGYGVPAIFMDSFFAEHVATTLGLPPLVNQERKIRHMLTAYPQMMQIKVNGRFVGPPNVFPVFGPYTALTTRTIEETEVWSGATLLLAAAYIDTGKANLRPDLIDMGLELAESLSYWLNDCLECGFLFNNPEGWMHDDPTSFRSTSFNRTRSGIDLLNTWKPIANWAVPPPPASLYSP